MNTPKKDIHLFMPFRVIKWYKEFLLNTALNLMLLQRLKIRKTAVCLHYNERKTKL